MSITDDLQVVLAGLTKCGENFKTIEHNLTMIDGELRQSGENFKAIGENCRENFKTIGENFQALGEKIDKLYAIASIHEARLNERAS